MANIRAKDLDVKASFASDDEVMFDSPSGTGTMTRDAFIAAVASIIVASPSTYKIATLDGSNKLTSSQDPSQAVSYKGTHDVSGNSPALADGSGTAGDTYYVSVAGSRNYGSGSLTLAVGDALVYSGSVWQKVSGIANVLDGQSTASGARTVLSVKSIDESMDGVISRIVAPMLRYNGSTAYTEIADSNLLSFVTGTDDKPMAVDAVINMEDATNFVICGKYGTSDSVREWLLYVDSGDKLAFLVRDAAGITASRLSASALTSYEGKNIHVCATYAGAGPNSANGFTNAANGINLYVNGELISMGSPSNNASYAGMSNTAQAVWIGRQNVSYAKGLIGDVGIHNRVLSATDVRRLANGALGYADEWAGTTQTSGTLTVGRRYRLLDFIAGDDFTNVGAGSNADLVEFIATGTTPTTWTNSSVVEPIGTVARYKAENTVDGKILDLSSNKLNGTINNAILVGGRKGIRLDTDAASAGNKVFSIYNETTSLAYITDKGDANVNSIASGASTELTIATGAVTATKSYHTIDTEGDAASDDLDTIGGGRAGQILVVQANNSARTVVLKDGTGNLKLSGDISLDNAEDTATLVSDGTNWYLLATSNNGA